MVFTLGIDAHPGFLQLLYQSVQVIHPQVHHALLRAVAEVLGVRGKLRKHCHSGRLRPVEKQSRGARIARNAELHIPRRQSTFGITGDAGPTALFFDGPESTGMTVFSQFPSDTKYFGDGPQQCMVNLRVDDLDGLVKQLEEAGVRIDPKREDRGYGKFAWIWDPEGNRVELWQPV